MAELICVQVWCVVLLLTVTEISSKPSCPSPGPAEGSDTGFNFTRGPPASEKLTCLKHYTKVFCCAVGYKSIKWYQVTEPTGLKLIRGNSSVYTEERNQSLVIEQSTENINVTCEITNKMGQSQSYNIKIINYDCGKHGSQPVFIGTPDQLMISASVGNNVTMSCDGYFGTSGALNEQRNSIFWKNEEKIVWNKNTTVPVFAYDPRIKTNQTGDGNSERLKLDLSITNVQESDFGVYTCMMDNAVIGGSVEVNFTLTKIVTMEMMERSEWKNGFAPAVILIVLVVVIALLFYKRLDLKLGIILMKDRLGLVEDRGNRIYDAFILYNGDSRDDEEFTCDHLKKKLEEEFNYSVCLYHRDFEVGDAKMDNYLNTLKRSHCMIMVISPEFIKDEWCVFTALRSLKMVDHPKLIFIKYKKIDSHHWSSLSKTRRQISEKSELKAALKLGYKVVWPGERSDSNISVRKVKHFWKEIRVKMPAKPREKKVMNSFRRIESGSESEESLRATQERGLHVDITKGTIIDPDDLQSPITPGTALTFVGSARSQGVEQNPLSIELKNADKEASAQRGLYEIAAKLPKYQISVDSGMGDSFEWDKPLIKEQVA